MKILVIEDNKALSQTLNTILLKAGHMVDLSLTGSEGLDNALTGIYDLLILDWMLPDLDGMSVLSQLRAEGISSPVLMLTAKEQVEDKITALDLGADDYLTKPFDREELLARVRALGRRRSAYSNENLSFHDLELDTNSLNLISNSSEIKLSLKESHIMEMLILAKGSGVSKASIIEKVWGYDSNAEDNYVEVYISFLRRKLLNLNTSIVISTLRGIGYCLKDNHDDR